MSDRFCSGELVELHGFKSPFDVFNGSHGRVESTGPLACADKVLGSASPFDAYAVRFPGMTANINAGNLRPVFKKRRDIDQVVSWKDCAWQPEEVRA